MVFESIVAEILNRYLGDYVENLDAKQLNLGIWGGDVVLRNLDVRPTALDNLDLPLKLKSGSLGTLTLKIPWKNLYTEPVIASIEDLYIVATPNLGIKYDADKENKQEQDVKQRELERIEEQRKAKRKKPDPADAQQQDTFVEKLVTQVIKNLQVTIRDIHIRYEDEFTNPKRPFAVGVTLHSLVFQTTDENWKPCVLKEAVKMFHKLVDLDSMTLYWNSGTTLVSHIEGREETKRAMKQMIASKTSAPEGFNYMLSPMSISARLIMNPKPETDGTGFKVPKIRLSVSMKELGFHMGKYQYQDILEFLEAQERLRLNALYRKYRPDLRVYKGHAKEWWHFAMDCVLKDQIHRRRRNWSWAHMKAHRDLVKKYTAAWVEKRTDKSPSSDVLSLIGDAEKRLDVFNLNIARQQAELYIDRNQLKRVEEQGGMLNYVKSWWGGGKQTKDEDDIASKFEKAMTPEERAKLYDAIDYQENQLPTTYPKEFVENKVSVSLDKLLVIVDDNISETTTTEVMILCWQTVVADVEQRPSANAIKFDARMETFGVEGIEGGDGQRPPIVSAMVVDSEEEKRMPQVLIQFETNPLDRSFDQLVKLHARPLSVVYNAPSINKLAEVFRPPESVRLKQLAATAFAKYEDIKERSAAGFNYALEKRAFLKLDINILPTIIQIPYRGVMEKSSDVLVLDLGTLRISTLETAKVKTDEEFYRLPEAEKLKLLHASAYDRFQVELKTLQMLFARPDDNWRNARTQKTSPMHFLQPTGWSILLQKAAIDDLRLPKLQVLGELPDLNFTASDNRMLDILKLLISIPTPPPAPEPATIEEEVEIPEPSTKDRAKMKAILEAKGDELKEESEESEESEDVKSDETEKKPKEVNNEQVQVELSLILKQISVQLSRRVTADGPAQPYLNLNITSIGTKLKMRPLDMHAVVSLGGVEVQHMQYQAPGRDGPLYILENPMKDNAANIPLLQLDYIQADKTNPNFATQFHNTEQLVRIKGQPMNLLLYQEALVDLQNFALTLQKKLDAVKEAEKGPEAVAPARVERQTSRSSSVASSAKSALSKASAAQKQSKKRKAQSLVDDRIINTKLEADLAGLSVLIAMAKRVISDVRVEGLSAQVAMRPSRMEALVRLKMVSITDPAPEITYNKILSVAGEEVFSLRFVQYNRSEKEIATMGTDDVDMEVVLSLAEMRFVFLYLHISQLLLWLTPFQEAASAAADQAGAAVQEGAKNTAVAIQEMRRTTKMKMSVDIHAPIIIVPQSSTSDEALLADFGKLAVGNRFTTSPLRGGSKNSAIFDNVTVQLRDMKLSRVILGDDRWSVVAECRLLEPVSFELVAIRNLSFEVFKEKPELAVVGKLPLLKVCASSEDYGVVMKTLSGNLSEGVAPPPSAPPKKAEPKPSSEKTPAESAQVTVQAVVEAAPVENKVKMEFAFEIECISAQLYDGSSDLLAGLTERDPSKALALVEIKTIAVRGAMTENGSMDAKVFLYSFIMDDSRINRVGITRLMDKKGGASASKYNMIDIVYSKEVLADTGDGPADKQRAEIILRPFFLCVAPEFLGALARFVVVTKTEEEIANEERTKALMNSMRAQRDEMAEQRPQQPVPTPSVPSPSASSMDVHVSVQDPEIVLVEDATAPETTKAIILTLQADLRMNSGPELMVVTGGVKELGITSSFFALEKRDVNPLKVLSPCDIELAAEMPKEAGQRIRIAFTPMRIRISPNVIGLLSAVGAHMAVAPEQSARDKQRQMIARQHVWDQKTVVDGNFWFLNEVLKAEEAVERLFTPVEDIVFDDGTKEDKCCLEMEKIELTLEADAGAGTVPMIHLTSSFNAQVKEWTRQMSADASLKLELWYYNERFNVWEPLIEPVIESDGSRRPWEVETCVMQHSEYDTEDTEVVIQPPKMSVAVMGLDPLQLTVTKTLLDLLTELGDAFARAAKRIEPKKPKGVAIDFLWAIENDTGLSVEVADSDTFALSKDLNGATLPYYTMVELLCSAERGNIGAEDDNLPMLLKLNFPDVDATRIVDVARAEKRIFSLPKSTQPGEQWHVVVDTASSFGNKLVTVRSPVKFINHLPVNIEIYYRANGNVESAGAVPADDGTFSPALNIIYTASGELTLQPSDDKYEIGRQAICWRDFRRNADWNMLIDCPSVDGNPSKSYFVQASIEIEEAYFENTHRKNIAVPCYTVHLSAPTLFRNALPYPVEISATGVEPQVLKGGESASLCAVVPGKSIGLKIKANVEWTCQLEIKENFEELTQHTFHARDPQSNAKMEMDLGLRMSRRLGTREMTLYAPFWMVNKTGQRLSYKDYESRTDAPAKSISPCSCFKGSGERARESEHHLTIFEHPPGSDEPLLFTFSGESFFAKNKKACLKVGASEWSEKFPMDIVGSAGKVACKTDSGKEFEVSVNIQLSYSGLTKICTFTPFYLVDNRTNADVEVRQVGAGEGDQWTRIPREQCLGFWPEKKSKRMQMCCRYADGQNTAESQAFPFTESFESLVVLPNEFVGVYVSTHISDNAVVVALEEYQDGMAPVLLVNDTDDVEVYYRQKDIDQVNGLPAGQCVLFSWSSVLAKRQLLWTCGDAKNVNDELMKDGMGEVNVRKDTKIYWVSFLSGRQRILLFTQDLAVATTASKPYELERIDQQFTLSIQSINISLINNLVGMEIASMAVTSSGVVWEYKKRRFRAYSIKDNKRLEEAFIRYNNDKNEGKKVKSRVMIGNKIEVDFEEWKQYKPKEVEIRRSFQSGLWIQYMVSQHEQQVHIKANHFQIDNQLPVAVFRTFFAPVPPAKSVAAESIPKPFAELSFIMRKVEHSNIPQIKYFMVLVQEMAVQADKGFINAMIGMFTNETASVYGTEQYEKDVDITRQSLVQLAAVTSSTEQKAYYEYLHFSPMKIHLSFSQGGSSGDEEKAAPIHSEVLNLLLKSVGVTLTEIQDVQFKLAYLERKAVFMNRQQLISEAISHYTKQAIKQLYVLVLGLDIMGNPFGLIRDLSTGVETFFYEPIQGAIQGPEEFAEGLALGLKGLFGGAVGGAAGAVSRITGTLGKGLAALTLDDEYQKKRQQMLSKRPANVQEGFAQGAKGLAMGFVEGVTGVFTKPIEGAKKGGVGGFAKGVGKGVVGLVTRPVSGVVDFASSSLQAVKRVADTSDEVKKLRPARFIEPDKIIRPFSLRNAEGNELLQEANKGKYASTDVYVEHAAATGNNEFTVVVTDRRIMMVSKTLGALEIDWQYPWKELAEAPVAAGSELKVKLKETKKKLFGSSSQGKRVKFADQALCEMIAARAREAFERDQ